MIRTRKHTLRKCAAVAAGAALAMAGFVGSPGDDGIVTGNMSDTMPSSKPGFHEGLFFPISTVSGLSLEVQLGRGKKQAKSNKTDYLKKTEKQDKRVKSSPRNQSDSES